MNTHRFFAALPAIAMFLFFTDVRQQASAHRPVEFFEVIHVRPVNTIEHAVELQSTLDAKRVESNLVGPEFIARSVGCMGRPASIKSAFLNWYRIGNPMEASPRTVSVLDLIGGEDGSKLTLGAAEFVLSPAQRIQSGPPDQIPEGLDHYIAYRIVDPSKLGTPIDIESGGNTQSRKVVRSVFCCVSAKQWHHDEFIDATHPRDCFVVYEMESRPNAEKFSTIDQFGMNRLRASKSVWLGVRATLLDLPTE